MSVRRSSLLILVLLTLPVLAACSSSTVPDATVDDPLGIDGADVELAPNDEAALVAAAEPRFTGSLSTRTIAGPVSIPDTATSATFDVGISQIVLEPPEDEGFEHPSNVRVQALGLSLTLNDGVNGSFETVGINASINQQTWRFQASGDCPSDTSCTYEPSGDASFEVTLAGDALDRWRTVLTGGLETDTISGSAFLEFTTSLDAVSATVTLSAPEAEITTGD
jgi:hypothetical protein